MTFRALLLSSLAIPALLVPAAPVRAISQDASGGAGSPGSGHDHSDHKNGNGGDPGHPGGTITLGTSPAPLMIQDATSLISNGGTGGQGVAGDGGGIGYSNGGAGGGGGQGGPITLYSTATVTGAGTVFSLTANGGDGAQGGIKANYGHSGQPGTGGQGGTLLLQLGSSILVTTGGGPALALTSNGGNGLTPLDAQSSIDSDTGTTGGGGGNGGQITATVGASVTNASGTGILLLSQGGHAGDGGFASGPGKAVGGTGGTGGAGGSLAATLTGMTSISAQGPGGEATGSAVSSGSSQITPSILTGGLILQSLGGAGGQGAQADGASGRGGNGGNAGGGGSVTVVSQGANIISSGYASVGILAQSAGAAAGSGSTIGALFRPRGGNGGAGGAGGAVEVTLTDNPSSSVAIVTRGAFSDAVVAQSLGGGGGHGGSVSVAGADLAIAIGGIGGAGGSASTVTVTNSQVVSTHGASSIGILAQSVAGGGGRGGDAFAGSDIVSLAVGGSGGAGGVSNNVQVVNNGGIIQTLGDSAHGIAAQSIAGGGGVGGAANTLVAGVQVTTSVSIGGSGGAGGAAGTTAVANNGGQITTQGDHAYGILAQSISGGGGAGGSTSNRTFSFSAPDYPSLALNLAFGGSGGGGGQANAVTVSNGGGIVTSGDAAHAILAQSISGGGGAGGSGINGQVAINSPTITINRILGGTGGVAGTPGQVTVNNDGLVMTVGHGANGILAQSISGGGGAGGSSVSNSGDYRDGEYKGLTFTLSQGASGGSGGAGGAVQVTNGGGITVRGDGSTGILAQSIGGGGGAGGDAQAMGSGGYLAVSIGLGGSGGSGNTGGSVTVANNGNVLTQGGQSPGIHAQSIGGGGGTGGTGAGGGGTNAEVTASNFLASGAGVPNSTIQRADGIYAIKSNYWGDFNVYEGLRNLALNYETQNDPEPEAPSADPSVNFTLSIGAGRGGSGGSGMDGGAVTVSSLGLIGTSGPASPGIIAQSIGGGGGAGGAAAPLAGGLNISGDISFSGGLGGAGGVSGGGSTVTVNANGGISTAGDMSPGLIAQSVGGGGGLMTATTPTNRSLSGSPLFVMGGIGSSGDGGFVSVLVDPKGASYTVNGQAVNITTTGADSPGVIAQSIGGGGGIGYLMTVNPAAGGGRSQSDPNGPAIPVILGSQNRGDGGDVAVQMGLTSPNGRIVTTGANSYGVLAQSIGGGGGLMVGQSNPATNTLASLAGRLPVSVGNGGAVSVVMENNFSITTSGAGAAGILAQSIGGSGGLFGRMSNVDLTNAVQATPNVGRAGSGGPVTLTLSGSIVTNGTRAHGVVAQSLGGGGGIIDLPAGNGFVFAGARSPSCVVADCGTVQVNIENGGLVAAGGAQSFSVFAQSRGNASNDVSVTLVGGRISASGGAVGVFLDGEDSNTVSLDASSSITATQGSTTAIQSNQRVTGTNAGTITGNLLLPGGSAITNTGSGTLQPLGIMDLASAAPGAGGAPGGPGSLTNAGTLDLTRISSRQQLIGRLDSSGRIVVGTDHTGGTGSRLDVTGTAHVSGAIEARPVVMANAPATVLTASKGLTVDPDLTAVPLHLYTFQPQQTGNSLAVQPSARFVAQAAGLGDNQRQVASHLQGIWDSGTRFDAGFTVLTRVADAGGYRTALNSLSGQTVGAISAARFAASRNFVTNLQSCPSYEGLGVVSRETACAWARVFGSGAAQNTTSAALGYGMASQTVQFGGQWQLRPDWFLGVSGGYEYSRFSGSEGSSRVTGDNLLLAAVLKHQRGNWLFSAGVDGGYGWYDSSRSMSLGGWYGVARGSPTAWHLGLNGRVSYQIPFETWYLKPSLDLHATHVRSGSYTETGAAPFNLTVDARSSVAVAATAMLEVGTRIDLGERGVLRPYGRLGVSVIGVDDWAATARFAGLSASSGFRAGTPIPGTMGRFAVGATLTASERWDVTVQYGADVSGGYLAHTGTARVAYRF